MSLPKTSTCPKSQTIALAGICLALTGCGAVPTRVEIQRVNVSVPVECKEQVPDRPAMPTEALRPGATVDQAVQAAFAEIERREGYELQMRAALVACTAPMAAAPVARGR